MQMDALGAFAYLSDNIPTWTSHLSELTNHTTAKHAEFAEAFKKHSVPFKPRRKKNSSVCSIRTDSARGRRRRGSGGSASGSDGDNSSFGPRDGTKIVSTRHNLVVHYDGHTQQLLEDLVRNIGTARNNLRRGRMSQLAVGGGRRPPPRSGTRAMLSSLESAAQGDLMANVRSARSRGPPQPAGTARQSPFDITDKNLELAHSFCETAAYQFLRAGGCTSELDSIKDRFGVLLKIAREEVQLLEKEKKEKQEQEEKEAENSPKAPEPEKSSPGSFKRPASSEGMIEVDDEQVSVESIDLSAFRVNRTRR